MYRDRATHSFDFLYKMMTTKKEWYVKSSCCPNTRVILSYVQR
jgi:hypothetical protein